MSLQAKATGIRLLLLDVDGVLTDGAVVMHADGSNRRAFTSATALLSCGRSAQATVGLLSARSSGATAHQAAQLAVRLVAQASPAS
jgi:3-deoxy-D-manno-octulosonate 8-phosphate phosphatase (KDO 8-P phosphatase)